MYIQNVLIPMRLSLISDLPKLLDFPDEHIIAANHRTFPRSSPEPDRSRRVWGFGMRPIRQVQAGWYSTHTALPDQIEEIRNVDIISGRG